MHRTQSQASERRSAVPTRWPGAEQLVLRAARGVAGESGSYAGDRPPLHQAAVLRYAEGPGAIQHQPKARPAAHATDGPRSGVPETIDQSPRPRPQGLPVFTAEYGDYELNEVIVAKGCSGWLRFFDRMNHLHDRAGHRTSARPGFFFGPPDRLGYGRLPRPDPARQKLLEIADSKP